MKMKNKSTSLSMYNREFGKCSWLFLEIIFISTLLHHSEVASTMAIMRLYTLNSIKWHPYFCVSIELESVVSKLTNELLWDVRGF